MTMLSEERNKNFTFSKEQSKPDSEAAGKLKISAFYH
jgi:hypothetical protein